MFFKASVLFLPFGLAAILGYYRASFWLVLIVSLVPLALVLLIFDPMAKSEFFKVFLYFGISAISASVGFLGGKFLRDHGGFKD